MTDVPDTSHLYAATSSTIDNVQTMKSKEPDGSVKQDLRIEDSVISAIYALLFSKPHCSTTTWTAHS